LTLNRPFNRLKDRLKPVRNRFEGGSTDWATAH